uniref:Uncharacterized protein n=1 Tax=Panagrolaimus superbus TaxID=310955 RepID=A0A914YKU7_9BILA
MAYQISEKEIEEANQHMENWINEVSPLEGDDDIENCSAIGDQVLEKDEQNESDEQDNAQLLEKDEKNESCPEDKEKGKLLH